MSTQSFKYRREDFQDLPVTLNHLTIYLNFLKDRVEARNRLEMTAKCPLEQIELDARDLEILEVQWRETEPHGAGSTTPLDYEYRAKQAKLVVRLPHIVAEGERFAIQTFTRCTPSDHILEGIYRDVTPPGAPQQYMSQCQQWGFQRIMPILDDCRAKCTMTTTIEADAAYTHLISNGNVSRSTNPDGRPVAKPGAPHRQVITYENPVPMAPYLFLVCAGTWDVLVDQVIYPSGRTVHLEYLVPPGRTEAVRIPMEILKRSIIWIGATQDYEYTGDTYRTICMTKSNFGGMENVGNTTIVTDAALIDEHTLDASLLYAHAVIVHEFEHNQCGSETTMESPFDVWLNEAYTVHVERQFMADLFDPTLVRLMQVDSIRNPLLGPLAIEDGGHVGRIVREGFNDPDELIDGVTYVKAAEVIRMLHLILGDESFRAGKELYFSRYRHGNANTDQFFECFEEVSGRPLEAFKKNWLYTIGYPKVTAEASHDATRNRFSIRFAQHLRPDLSPFHLPVQVALVDESGNDIAGTRRVFELEGKETELVFEDLPAPPTFASVNRDYSFYGAFELHGLDPGTLARQALLDPNRYNRVDAVRRLTERERVKLLTEPGAAVDPDWIELYGELLSDRSLPPGLKAFMIRIDEQPLERAYSTWYPELVAARERLMLAVNGAWRERLMEELQRVEELHRASGGRPGGSPTDGIQERMLKQVLLELIAIDDTPSSHRLILDQLGAAATATERVAALLALNRSSAAERLEVLERIYGEWHPHLSGYANYLRVVAGGTRPDVFDLIAREQARSTFDITQPTWCRALYLPMATNNKMVWTEQGIAWVGRTVTELAPINATTASRLLNTFQHVVKLKQPLRDQVKRALETIRAGVSEEVCPTVHGQAGAYLRGLE